MPTQPDCAVVSEFVSRLGKSRSSSLDGPGMAAAAAGAGAGAADRPAEPKPAPDSDKWSRLTEFTEKITKTVEGEWMCGFAQTCRKKTVHRSS